MPLLRVAGTTLKADALLVFSWVGENSARVVAASDADLEGLPLTLPLPVLKERAGVLLELERPQRVISTALAVALPWPARAALVIQAGSPDVTGSGGMLALWESVTSVPERLIVDPMPQCIELRRMADEWLARSLATDRALLFEQVIRGTDDALVFLPEDGQHALLNDSAGRLLGLPTGYVAGAQVALRMRDLGQRVLNGAEREAMAEIIFGSHRDVRDSLWEVGPEPARFFRVSSVLASSSMLRGRTWIFRDVTAEQRAMQWAVQREAEVAAKHSFLRGVVEAVDDAVVAADSSGILTPVNTSAERRYAPGASVPVDHPLWDALGGIAADNVERQRRQADGRIRDLLVSTRVLHDATGVPIGAVAVERDITERKAMEAHLRQSEKLEALGRMAASITHDLNNLLTVIHSTVGILLEQSPSAEVAQEDLLTIATAVEDSRTLTRSLLDFCRGRARTTSVLDPIAIVRRLQPLLTRLAPAGVEVAVTLPQPSGAGVLGDAAEYEQLILNLVWNAMDAMPAGGRLAVDLDGMVFSEAFPHPQGDVPPGEYIVLRVTDSGRGMTADVLSRLFEPFFTTKEHGHGVGLGLATVYGVVERSEGHIRVDSVEGIGSTFHVFLPAIPLGDTPPGEAAVIDSALTGAPDAVDGGSRARVLVVDDEPTVRRAVVRFLAQFGYACVSAPGGAEALAMLRSVPVDVVLTDMQMPGVNGAQLVQAMRQENHMQPVVLMSGYTDIADALMDTLTGVVGVLTKPFTQDEVQTALDRAAQAAPATASG